MPLDRHVGGLALGLLWVGSRVLCILTPRLCRAYVAADVVFVHDPGPCAEAAGVTSRGVYCVDAVRGDSDAWLVSTPDIFHATASVTRDPKWPVAPSTAWRGLGLNHHRPFGALFSFAINIHGQRKHHCYQTW
jgi:hypothetical protein